MTRIVAIRIKGRVNVDLHVRKTLDMLRLRKKFSCVILDDKPETIGKLKKVKDFIAYGIVKEETVKKLIKKRAKIGNKPLEIDGGKLSKFVESFMKEKVGLKDLNIKPFFSLHPPRGGFKKSTRLLFPRGVLGKNENINELVLRML